MARKCLKPAAALGALLLVCGAAGAQEAGRAGVANDPAALRQILAAQPDYRAEQTSVILGPQEGFGGKSKVARMGRRNRSEEEDVIFISEPGRPTIKIYRKRKEYSELPAEERPSPFPLSAAELARSGNDTFELAGGEKVGDYDCLKIRASYREGKVEAQYLFFVAPELRNLVVREEIHLGPMAFVTLLENVSLDVPEDLFKLPAGYKKIAEPAPADLMKEMLRNLEKRAGRGPQRRRRN